MVNIPKLYKTKIIAIDVGEGPVEIELRGYRPIDIEYVAALQNLKNQIPEIFAQLSMFEDVKKKMLAKINVSVKSGRIDEEKLKQETMKEIVAMSKNGLSDDMFTEMLKVKEKTDSIELEITKLSYALGQRGLKRFFYKDEPEFKEAERANKTTEYIDGLPDIEVDPIYLKQVAYTMIELGGPSEKLQETLEKKADDKGKPKADLEA